VRAESDRPQHYKGVDVSDREAGSTDMPGELPDEVQRPGVLGVRVILGKVSPQVPISDGTGQRVD
jgi:hypothetical protein